MELIGLAWFWGAPLALFSGWGGPPHFALQSSPRRILDLRRAHEGGVPVPSRPEPGPEVHLRVVLTADTLRELDVIAEAEDLERSTVANRAIQLYAAVRQWQSDGSQIYLRPSSSGRLDRLIID